MARRRTETDNAVHDIRRIIDGLRPTVLGTSGLTRAVQRHAGTIDSALPVEVTAESPPVLAPDVDVAPYRIITEAGACSTHTSESFEFGFEILA